MLPNKIGRQHHCEAIKLEGHIIIVSAVELSKEVREQINKELNTKCLFKIGPKPSLINVIGPYIEAASEDRLIKLKDDMDEDILPDFIGRIKADGFFKVIHYREMIMNLDHESVKPSLEGRPERDRPISQEDINNLIISLETSTSLENFLQGV